MLAGREQGDMFWIILILFLTVFCYQTYVLGILPTRIAKTGLRGDHDAAIARLERLMKLPSFNGESGRVFVLFNLADRCVVAKRYEDALPWLTRLMAIRNVPGELEPIVHSRYADCCEALGRPHEAVEHRRYAATAAQAKPESYAAVLARGDELDRRKEYDEACEHYGNALGRAKLDAKQKTVIQTKLAVSALRAGRPETVVRVAGEALSQPVTPDIAMMLHRLAGTAYSSLGDLERSGEELQKAYDLAEARQDLPHQAEALAGLSGVARNQGRLAEALETARRAVSLQSPPPKVANIYLYEVLMLLGRYQEAWGVVTGSSEQIAFLPHQQKATAGIDSLTLARVCLEIGQPQDAWSYWQGGAAAFIDDPKMGPYVRSLGAVLQAHLGMADDARRQVRYVAETLETTTLARGSKLDKYAYLVRAAALLGDHADCLRFLEVYRALKPYRADLPRTLYYAGESCLRTGDRDRAASLFREAASACPEAIYAEHARTRLSEMGVALPHA